MRATCRSLVFLFSAFALTAAMPETFSREELDALEAERVAAERKLEALESAGETALSDIKNIDTQLIAAAMESQRREEQASSAEKSLIDLGTRRVSAQMKLLENRQALEDLLAALAASNRRKPPAEAGRDRAAGRSQARQFRRLVRRHRCAEGPGGGNRREGAGSAIPAGVARGPGPVCARCET